MKTKDQMAKTEEERKKRSKVLQSKEFNECFDEMHKALHDSVEAAMNGDMQKANEYDKEFERLRKVFRDKYPMF